MSESSNNSNDEVTRAAYEFLEGGRAAASRRPRRVPFRTLTRMPVPLIPSTPSRMRPASETDVFDDTPAGRYRRERDNLLRFLQPFENHQAHNAAFVSFLEMLNDFDDDSESSSDSEEEEEVTVEKPLYKYVFKQPKDLPDDWQCAVCFCEHQEDVVLHPEKCHSFHRECLARWLDEKPSCPICRRCVTPLLMTLIE